VVTVAVLGRPRGNRGELTATSMTDPPERLAELTRVFLVSAGTESKQDVERVWFHDGVPVFKFAGVDSISDAEAWRGAQVRIPIEERRPLEQGEVFVSDLIGCEVFEGGEKLGAVVAFHETGGKGLLEVDGDLLIPFTKEICHVIDPASRRIDVALPAGLKELNRP
jgi:16S rRNA processing protein RimM